MADIISNLGINILEEEIDDVIFQTNEFLTDATFTGSQGPFWWILLANFQAIEKPSINQPLTRIFTNVRIFDGTKTGQKSNLSTQRPVCSDALFRLPLHPHAAKVLLCPVTSKELLHISLFHKAKHESRAGFKEVGRYSRLYFPVLPVTVLANDVEKFFCKIFDRLFMATLPILSSLHCTLSYQCHCQTNCQFNPAGVIHPGSFIFPFSLVPDRCRQNCRCQLKGGPLSLRFAIRLSIHLPTKACTYCQKRC